MASNDFGEAIAAAERERIIASIKKLRASPQQIRLQMGELTAQEMRCARALLDLVCWKIHHQDL